MRKSPDRLNATVLSLVALVLLGVGGYGLARGFGRFGDARATDPVLGDDTRAFVARNANWFWPLAAVVAVLVAWLGLRWLLAQLHSPASARLPVRAEGPGRTELVASAAAVALANDIDGYPGVRRASARIVADHPSPEVDITVDVFDDVDLRTVRRRIEEHALPRFRTALELTELRSRLHVRLTEPAGRSVR